MSREQEMKEFFEGKSLRAWKFFGAHVNKKGVTFRTYAPGATGVNVFGDFNHWFELPMERDEYGCWSVTVSEAKPGDLYKYVIYGHNNWRAEHADPYAFGAELRPGSASRITELSGYEWYDIMRLAAYRQFNNSIPQTAECCKTGRLKRNYGVEPIMRMLTGNSSYFEVHNAVMDAVDELKIMELLGHGIEKYECARI